LIGDRYAKNVQCGLGSLDIWPFPEIRSMQNQQMIGVQSIKNDTENKNRYSRTGTIRLLIKVQKAREMG